MFAEMLGRVGRKGETYRPFRDYKDYDYDDGDTVMTGYFERVVKKVRHVVCIYYCYRNR